MGQAACHLLYLWAKELLTSMSPLSPVAQRCQVMSAGLSNQYSAWLLQPDLVWPLEDDVSCLASADRSTSSYNYACQPLYLLAMLGC